MILFGCSFWKNPRLTYLIAARILIILTPPPVEDEHAPVIKTINISILQKAGQRSKSAVAYPVVVITETMWKKESLIAFDMLAYPP